MESKVRIIGGQFRGKTISFPQAADLRPTGDRIKETLFNWLMHDIQGAICLDAFAGSGSLGFEACSRGAKQVYLVEASTEVFKSLKVTKESFKDSVQLVQADALAFLESTKLVFDIIFLDPPFKGSYLQSCLELLAKSPCLAVDGLVYIESPDESALDLRVWNVRKSKKAGQVYYALVEKL